MNKALLALVIILSIALAFVLIFFVFGKSDVNNNIDYSTPTISPAQPIMTVVPSSIPVVPTSAPTVNNPVITKNPTPESVNEGGSCQFVAYATGYKYMCWQLISPNGTIYDASSSNPYPGILSIWGANNETLFLSNIPRDMNNWSVRAVFVGDTQRVSTNGAALTVIVPKPVYVNISFSSNSGTTFADTLQYVNVYSSTGDPIRVECTQSGESGAYYSDTISSGSSFPVQGIYGQYVTVDVVASCGNSTARATYYVDCTPSSRVKYGTVNYCDGTNAYIVFDDGTSGTYDISYKVSNPPSGGERCTCTFDRNGTLTDFSYEHKDPGSKSTIKYGTVSSCDGIKANIVFDDGTSGTYDISYKVSNPPTGGERCTCTFDENGNLTDFRYDRIEY